MTIVVLISAEAEWDALKELLPKSSTYSRTPFGEQCVAILDGQEYTFFQGGWGKIAAAASTQYAIDMLKLDLLINIGTCGGFAGHAKKGDHIIAERTVVYDIIEKMGDPIEALAAYSTEIDTQWLPSELPPHTRKGIMLSADRDVVSEDLAELYKHKGIVADWESGAIAWVANRNNMPVIIIRGVSDMISEHEAEAFNNLTVFLEGTQTVMGSLLEQLPFWTKTWQQNTLK